MLPMVEYFEPAHLFRMAMVALLGVLAIYVEAAPLGVGTEAPPSPDLLFCIVACWCMRQPNSVPLLLVFVLGIFRDLLTDLPVGAGVLSLVAASEVLKIWRRRLSRAQFPSEWVAVSLTCLCMTALVWLLMTVTFAQPPAVLSLLQQCLYTIMAYPLFVLVLRWGLRLHWQPAAVAR